MSTLDARAARRTRCAACVLLATCAGWAAPVQAWTRASLQGASARLEVRRSTGRARVALELELRVLGGWLSKLELTGLDAELALWTRPPRPGRVRGRNAS